MSESISAIARPASCHAYTPGGMTFRSLPCLFATDSAREPRLAAGGRPEGDRENAAAGAPSIVTFGNFVAVPTSVDAFGPGLRDALDDFVLDLRRLVVERIELVGCSWNESPSAARKRAGAIKQYLADHGAASEDVIQVHARCVKEPVQTSLRFSLRREVEARVVATLPEPPLRNPTLWALPSMVLKGLPQRIEDFDEVLVRRLDHAARNFRNTGVSWVEISIVSPPRRENDASPEDLDAFLAAVHLVKNHLVGRGLAPSIVFLKPWPDPHAAPANTMTDAGHAILVEAWAPEPDPMPRLALTEGYVPALRMGARYA